MTNVSYASTTSGPFAGAIGWINFPTTTLSPGSSTVVTNTLRDGSTITFTLSLNPSGTASFHGTSAPVSSESPFGNYGYNGISGSVVLYNIESSPQTNIINISNIVVTYSSSTPIHNYTIVLADGGITSGGQSYKIYQTDGNSWTQIGKLGNGSSPTYSGWNTNKLTLTANDPGTFNSWVAATNSPKNITITMFNDIITSNPIFEYFAGITFGIILTRVKVNKVINSRLYPNDQFTLSITGSTTSSTVTTTGSSNGLQKESPSVYITLDSISRANFVINEVMAPGSLGILGVNYSPSVRNSNLTPGGTIVPPIGTLNESMTIKLGDYILTTITNTNISPHLTLKKETCTCKACLDEPIAYTLKVKNTSLFPATTIVVTDTFPLGVAIASTTISTGTISNNNSVLTWTIPTLAGGESALAMIFAVPVDDFCYNKNKFLTSTAQIVSYYPPNPSNLPSDTSIIPVDCFCCNCKDFKN